MRGKGTGRAIYVRHAGITPAHAGKSTQIFEDRYADMDHPRPCGEKDILTEQSGQSLGSPPPMRGKGFIGLMSHTGTRITPAHAGKSRRYD